jgi:hypothetical protein
VTSLSDRSIVMASEIERANASFLDELGYTSVAECSEGISEMHPALVVEHVEKPTEFSLHDCGDLDFL